MSPPGRMHGSGDMRRRVLAITHGRYEFWGGVGFRNMCLRGRRTAMDQIGEQCVLEIRRWGERAKGPGHV